MTESKAVLENLRPSDILAITPLVTGVLVRVKCRYCRAVIEQLQPSIDTLVFGRYSCTGCQRVCHLWPEDFVAALDWFFPHSSVDELIQIKKESSRIARNWYKVNPLAEHLMYKGINLGEPTERFLLSFILSGLFQDHVTVPREL